MGGLQNNLTRIHREDRHAYQTTRHAQMSIRPSTTRNTAINGAVFMTG
jgi:hypothetical protein